MKLYLSSYKVGNDPEALRSLVGGGTRVAIVMNAADGFEDRLYVWPREEWAMTELGFEGALPPTLGPQCILPADSLRIASSRLAHSCLCIAGRGHP